MTVNELMAQLRTHTTGDLSADLKYISDTANDLRGEPNAGELVAACAEYAFAIMPEKVREEMQQQTFVGGVRMDQAFARAKQLTDDQKPEEAEPILAAISDKIERYFEKGEKRYFSFRNAFEYHMYRYLHPDDTDFDRAPFDFSAYLSLYGFVLVENHKFAEAIRVLKRSIAFNPVSADARFEPAELCKLTRDYPGLLSLCRETLPLCLTPERVARVLGNFGYYCYGMRDLFSAAVFYFESMRFSPCTPIEAELQDTVLRMKEQGMKFAPPTHGQIIDTFEKYGVTPPPNSDFVNLALTLAKRAKELDELRLTAQFYRIAFDMTNNADIRKALDDTIEELQRRSEVQGGK